MIVFNMFSLQMSDLYTFIIIIFLEVVDYSLRYATAEVYLNKGVRIHGEVGTVLSTQLTTPTSKTSTDEKGW